MTLTHVIWLRPRIHVEKFFILIVYQFEMALCTVINLYRNHEWAKNVEIKSENVQMAHIKYMWTGVLYIWIAPIVNKCLGWTAFMQFLVCSVPFSPYHSLTKQPSIRKVNKDLKNS